MRPEDFLGGGDMKVMTANDFIGGGDFKILDRETVEQKPKRDLLDKSAKIVSSIFPGEKIGEVLGTQIAKIGKGKEQREIISDIGRTSDPSALQVAGDVANAGLTVATLGGAGLAGGIGARILKMAGLGAGLSSSKTISEGGDLGDVAKSGAMGGTIGAALPVAGAGLRAIGKQIEQLPARFVNSALSRSKQQILQDISKDKVDDFAKYVIQSKPIGSANKLVNQSIDNVVKLSDEISVALKQASTAGGKKITVGVSNLLDDVARLPDAQGALLKRGDVKGIIERLAPQTKQLLQKKSLTVIEANKLRQLLDKTLGDRAFLGGQLSSDKAILKGFADSLRETVKTKAPEGTRTLFSELSNEIRFRDGLLDRIAKKQGNQVLSFGDFIGGGLGGIFGGGIPGAVGGVAARRAIESVPFKLGAAKLTSALTKTAPILEQLTPAQQTAILSIFASIFSDTDGGEEGGQQDNRLEQTAGSI